MTILVALSPLFALRDKGWRGDHDGLGDYGGLVMTATSLLSHILKEAMTRQIPE